MSLLQFQTIKFSKEIHQLSLLFVILLYLKSKDIKLSNAIESEKICESITKYKGFCAIGIW
jgi:hypothetical protein